MWLVVRRGDDLEPPLQTETNERAAFSFHNLDDDKLFARGASVAVVAAMLKGASAAHVVERRSWATTVRDECGELHPAHWPRIRRGWPPGGGRPPDAEGFWNDRPSATGDTSRVDSLWPELAAEYSAVTAGRRRF